MPQPQQLRAVARPSRARVCRSRTQVGAERVHSGCTAGAEGVQSGHALGCGEGAEKAGTLRGVPERNAVDAVALARGHRAIGEAVAQMATALLAHNLPRATAQGARRATTIRTATTQL